MQDRRPLSDDSVLMRWMRTEINKMNESIVFERKSLIQLMQEEKPSAKTKAGKDHFFETLTLRNLSESYLKTYKRNSNFPFYSSLIIRYQIVVTLTMHMLWKPYRPWERLATCVLCSRAGYGLADQ